MVDQTLLKLPYSFRTRLYELLGIYSATENELPSLPSLEHIFDLNGKRHQPVQYAIQFYGLLLSCRAIYEEASRFLYATNYFTVRFRERQSLSAIQNLSSASLSVLSHLQIIISEASCHDPNVYSWIDGLPCCSDTSEENLQHVQSCGKNHNHDEPADHTNPGISWEWQATIEHLASSITPDVLNLSIICDVSATDSGYEMAEMITTSLGHLPKLKSCSIRLCQQANPRLQQLAYDTVLQARRISISPQPVEKGHSPAPCSRFLTLPREIRLRILTYTDLVTPWCQVTWTPQRRSFSPEHWYCGDLAFTGTPCPPAFHHGCQFVKCYITYPKPSRGCFCRRRHTAFSSTPEACKCWTPPQALFLVCKILLEDAQAVFYGENRFIIFDNITPNLPYRIRDANNRDGRICLGLSKFLRKGVPAHCLHRLRFLEYVFPQYDVEARSELGSQRILEEWTQTLEWVSDKLNLGGLTIRIGTDHGAYPPRMDYAEGLEAISSFLKLVSPLACLGDKGLRAFYAQPVSPWTRSSFAPLDTLTALARVETELKERAERLVMGNRYVEPFSGAREDPPISNWAYPNPFL